MKRSRTSTLGRYFIVSAVVMTLTVLFDLRARHALDDGGNVVGDGAADRLRLGGRAGASALAAILISASISIVGSASCAAAPPRPTERIIAQAEAPRSSWVRSMEFSFARGRACVATPVAADGIWPPTRGSCDQGEIERRCAGGDEPSGVGVERAPSWSVISRSTEGLSPVAHRAIAEPHATRSTRGQSARAAAP